jgi:hypothetical protein
MMKGNLKAGILATCFLFVSLSTTAQEVVHALTGSVVSIEASAKTIGVYTDSHSESTFKDMTNPNTPINFDKSIRTIATSADTFNTKGAYVIVFYYGGGDERTAVALRGLGPGPFSQDTGTIVKIEGRNSISVADGSGSIKSFKLTPNTVAETDYGAVIGSNYQPHQGDKIRLTASVVNGNEVALFINSLVAN